MLPFLDRFDDDDAGGNGTLLDSQTLMHILEYRSQSISTYVDDLLRGHMGPATAYRDALHMFAEFGRAALADARNISVDPDATDVRKRRRLVKKLAELGETENLLDDAFARGGQQHVPLFLRVIVSRELRRLEPLVGLRTVPGLTNLDLVKEAAAKRLDSNSRPPAEKQLQGVLTVGQPHRFECVTHDLKAELFETFAPATDSGVPSGRVSVLSVPYMEGTRALWSPIVVGHEVAHIALSELRGAGYFAYLEQDLLGQLDDQVRPWVDVGLFGNWLEELLCDLNAVRMYGPAGFAAIAEMLYVLGSHHGSWSGSNTHPPIQLRIQVMLDALSHLCDEQAKWDDLVEPIVSPYRSLVTERTQLGHAPIGELAKQVAAATESGTSADSVVHMELVAKALAGLSEALVEQAIGGTPGFTDIYDFAERQEAIEHVRDALAEGRPAQPTFEWSTGEYDILAHADIINGAWLVHRMNGQTREDLLSAVYLDQLAFLSADGREFTKLWYGIPKADFEDKADIEADDNDEVDDAAIGEIVKIDRPALPFDTDDVPFDQMPGALLSGRAIQREITQGSLGVTPLLPGAVREAAIDVRLGTKFIAFKRSSTSAVDPLGDPHQWTSMEETVQTPWGGKFMLHPGECVLTSTLEHIILPDDIAAQVLTRSSYGRLGLITATAVQVQPATRCCITLELVNLGVTPIALVPGHRIAQLVCFRVEDPVQNSDQIFESKYRDVTGPESSKIYLDPELDRLDTMRTFFRDHL